jgi:hypothetical protein
MGRKRACEGERRPTACSGCGLRKDGPEEEKGRLAERKGKGGRGLKLFSKPFQLFKLLNLNSFQNLNTSSLFQNFQNNLKTFKTSHKQTINTMQPKDDAQALIASKLLK